jgi:hypothetical protein
MEKRDTFRRRSREYDCERILEVYRKANSDRDLYYRLVAYLYRKTNEVERKRKDGQP